MEVEGRTTCACVALKVPDDDDGMDLLLRLRGYYFLLPPLRDKAPIPRWTDGGGRIGDFCLKGGPAGTLLPA